ncbi:hypothetical protein L5470_08035 [Synechococcus sp. PCC 6717]|nr:hypothetical protein [Synechococcus sp. PCC 6717]
MTAPTRIKLWVTAQGKSEATRLQPVAQHPLGIPSLSRRGEVNTGQIRVLSQIERFGSPRDPETDPVELA